VVAQLVRNRDKRNLISSKVMRQRLGKEGIRLNDDLTKKQRAKVGELREKGISAFYRGARLIQRDRRQAGDGSLHADLHKGDANYDRGDAFNRRSNANYDADHSKGDANYGWGDANYDRGDAFNRRSSADYDADGQFSADEDWAPPPRPDGSQGVHTAATGDDVVVGANSTSGNNGTTAVHGRHASPASLGRVEHSGRSTCNGSSNTSSNRRRGSGGNHGARGFGRGTARGGTTAAGSPAAANSQNNQPTAQRPATRQSTRAITSFFSGRPGSGQQPQESGH